MRYTRLIAQMITYRGLSHKDGDKN